MLTKIDAHKFNTLIEINTLINSDYRDVHALLHTILESVTRLCGGEASSLLLVDKGKQELFFVVSTGSKRQEIKQFTIKLGEGIAGWVAEHNKSIIVNDVAGDMRHVSKKTDYPSITMMAVPMRIKDECIGVIEVNNKQDAEGFTHDDLYWLEIFANQAALAILNTKSIEQAHKDIKILEVQLNTNQNYHTMITKSPVILEKIEIIDRVAKTDSSVLILGESGVGKELFAERIHCPKDFWKANYSVM
jgi:Nif-specific regulatory protein